MVVISVFIPFPVFCMEAKAYRWSLNKEQKGRNVALKSLA